MKQATRLWPWVALLAVCSLLLFSPALARPGSIVAGDDVLSWFYPAKLALAKGDWNPAVNAGSPAAADIQSAAYYPVDMTLFFALPEHYAFSVGFAVHLFIAGLGCLLLCRRYSCSPAAGCLAGVAFMLSTFMVGHSYAGHYSMVAASAWLPWTLLGLDWAFEKRTISAAIVAGAPLGMQLLAGHVQIAFYTLLLLGAYASAEIIRRLVRKKRADALRLCAIGALVLGSALLLAAAQLVPSIELAMHATRADGVGYGFATQYSLPWQNILTIIAPNAYGTPLDGSYMNEGSYWELPLYCGVLTLVLAAAALIMRRDKRVWFLVGMAALSLLLALGKHTPLFGLLWKALPGADLFRAPARFGLFWTFAVALLGGIGLDQVLAHGKERSLRVLAVATLAGAVVLGLAAAVLQAANGFIATAIGPTISRAYDARHIAMPLGANAFVHGIAVDIAIAALLAFIAGALLAWRARRGPSHVGIAAVVILAVGLLAYGLPFIQTTPLDQAYATPQFVRYLQAQPGVWRVHDADGALKDNYQTVFGIETTQGYNPTRLAVHKALLSAVDANLSGTSLATLGLLNARYVVSRSPLDAEGLTLVHHSDAYVYENTRAMPRAFVVPSLSTLPTRNDANAANIIETAPDSSMIVVSADGTLVLSELAYPGWLCSVNGGPQAPPRVAYGAFRAVAVQAGDIVDCMFKPRTAQAGIAASIAGALLAIAALIAMRRARAR